MADLIPLYPTPGGSIGTWGTAVNAALKLQSSRPVSEYALIEYDGTTTAARRIADGAVITQGSNAGSVINAALQAASGTGGGIVRLDAVTIPLTVNITVPARTGLVGHHTYDRHSQTVRGTVLKASGLASTNAVIRAGVTNAATEGITIEGIAVDGNSQSHTVHTMNCTDLRLVNCTFIRGTDKNVWIESDVAPDDGGVAANIIGCMIRTTQADGTGLYTSGVGATDGIITGSRILNNTVGANLWGGWIMTACHVTGNMSSTANVIASAPQVQLVGNYFDSAGSGSNVVLNSHSHVVVGNQIFNHGDTTHTTVVGIALNGERHTISGNTFRMTDASTAAYGIRKNDNTVPRGVYVPNFMSTDGGPGVCFAKLNGTEMPPTDDANTYIAGNKRD